MSETDEAGKLRATRVVQYQYQMARHDHEWTILISRLSAYLTSQSLFATGAAVLEANDKNHDIPITFLAIVGFLISFMSSVSISINCRVIIEWHRSIQRLIAIDEAENKSLKDMYIPRGQPDWMHILSVDAFNILLPMIGGTSWLLVMSQHSRLMTLPGIVIFFVVWGFVLLYIYRGSTIEPSRR